MDKLTEREIEFKKTRREGWNKTGRDANTAGLIAFLVSALLVALLYIFLG